MDAGNLEGLISLAGGVVALLVAYEKILLGEKNKAYIQKHKKWLKPAAIIVILTGLLQLTGVL